MSEHYPVLMVVVPILAAVVPLVLDLWVDRIGWPVAVVGMVAHFGLALALAAAVLGGTPIEYEVGNFADPYGIALVVDRFGALVALLVSGISLGVLAYSRRAGPRSSVFYSLYMLLVAGLTGLSVTGDAFNMYVFLEITGLAAYGLVAADETGPSAVAALKYLMIGTVGASLFLLGVGYALVATGTLNMADLSAQLAAVGYASPLVITAFALMMVGLAVKSALFPLHTWQPDAYAGSPWSVSILISALVSTVSAYALARNLFSVFTVGFLDAVPVAQELLVGIASISVVAGSVLAVTQSDIKRMLAYSSVSQFGLVIAAFGIASETAVVGGIIHLLGHAVMKGGLFATAGVIEAKAGVRTIEEYAGLGDRYPFVAGAFCVLALAMVGVPPAVGFVGKWYIVTGAIEAGEWSVAAVLLTSTVLTLAYFARLIERLYFATPEVREPGVETEADEPGEMPAPSPAADGGRPVSLGMLAFVAAATLLAVGLGFVGAEFEQTLQPTVRTLLQ